MAALAQFRLPLQDKSNQVSGDGNAHSGKKMSTFEMIFRKAAEKKGAGDKVENAALNKPVKEMVADIETKVKTQTAKPAKKLVGKPKKIPVANKPADSKQAPAKTEIRTRMPAKTRPQRKVQGGKVLAPKRQASKIDLSGTRFSKKAKPAPKRVCKKPSASTLTRERRMQLADAKRRKHNFNQRQMKQFSRQTLVNMEQEKKRKERQELREAYEEEMEIKRQKMREEKERRQDDARRRKAAHDAQRKLKEQKCEEEKAFRYDVYKTRTAERSDVLQYHRCEQQKRRQSIMVRAKETQRHREIKRQEEEQQLEEDVQTLREQNEVDVAAKTAVAYEAQSVRKDIIKERKRILEQEKHLKSITKLKHAELERDMINWEQDTRLHEEELEASRRFSVMPVASTGIKKLNSMWKVFHEACKEEATNPITM